MTTKTPTTATKRTTKKTTPKDSTTTTATKRTTKKTTPKDSTVTEKTQRENIEKQVSTPTEIYPKAMQLVQLSSNSEQGKSFFWEEYSPRCAAITGENFETVYYFGFTTQEAATNFVKGITSEKLCKESSLRASKRFNPAQYPFEVKVWEMKESYFFHFVKRDLERNQPN